MAVEYLMNNAFFLPLISIALTTLVSLTLVPKLIKFFHYFKFFQSMPGEPSYSVLYGNLHKLPSTGEGRIAFGRKNMEMRNPRFSRMWVGPLRPTIVTYHPETVKIILKSSAPKSRGFGQVYEHVVPWIGEGLIASNGAIWARSRRLLTPAFHFDILKPYVGVYNEAVDTLFEKLDKFAESGESFDFCPLVTLCTLDVILKCAMSYDADVQRADSHPYVQATRDLTEIWSTRSRSPWLWPDFIFRLTSKGRLFYKHCDYVHKVAEELIEKRKLSLEKDGPPKTRHLDFLDILLTARDEDGNPMTTMEIRNEVDTFMFAGHDTTATSAPWILYTLAQHREYQTKVQAEIDAVLEGRDSDFIEWSDLTKLQMLSLCIKESMRLYPVVPFIQRRLTEDVVIEGNTIPANTNVSVAIIHLHRNPMVWDEPDEFKPERFKAENLKDRDSFAFVPFSAGSRNCIGQNFALNEEKVLIGRILRRYDVELDPDGPPVERKAQAILKSDKGIWFRLKRRQL